MTDVVARTVGIAAQAEEPTTRALLTAEPADVANSFGKRAVDIAGALFALLLFLPLLLCIAMAVRLESGGPVIFKQRRTGHCGRIFTIYKFRTMTVAEDCGNVRQATRDDARVTAIGSVLRKLSLDELPQLLNIIRGEMSIVGPRPVVEDELELYDSAAEFYLRSRPGLTGLWQISGRNDVSYATRVAFDTHYVQNWSLLADLVIVFKTIPAVCLSRGSY